jgi:DNA-binding CsgD family transcriptional regulator/PAS domain-containing protein
MSEQRKLTLLTTSIYDAALDQALWPEVLADIAEFVGGQVGGLLVKDSVRRNVSAHFYAGIDDYYLQLYADTYYQFGPIANSPSGDVEQILTVPDLVPYDEFRRGRFYQEWAEPQGWADAAMVALTRTASCCAYLSIARHETSGMVDTEMRRRLGLIVPHMRRAVSIHRTIESKEAETATFADIFDGMNAGVILIDANCGIVHANAAGRDILSNGDLLRSVGGRLAAGDSNADQTLRETVAGIEQNDAESGAKSTVLTLAARDGERYLAHVLPLTSVARRGASARAAAAAMFVRKAALEAPSPPEVIRSSYNLTPAELRVLLAIVEIGGVPDVAAALGIADTTVKTHLSRLFEKTGAARQADLVKLVAAYGTPLAH